MDKKIYFLVKLIQLNPELFCKEIINYTDENILIFITYLISTNKNIFNLLITFLGQNINTNKNNILQMF